MREVLEAQTQNLRGQGNAGSHLGNVCVQGSAGHKGALNAELAQQGEDEREAAQHQEEWR